MADPKRILVIEDDEDVGIVLKFGLERGFGALVEVVSNGLKGVGCARRGNYDLILCDLMMPQLDGIEVVRRLRQEEPSVATRVIFVTAAAQATFRTKSPQEYGASGVLAKPVDLRTLCDRIRAMLATGADGAA